MAGPWMNAIAAHRTEVDAALVLALMAMMLIVCLLYLRVGRLNRLYLRLTRNTSGGNIEEILIGYMDTVRQVEARLARMEERVEELARVQKTCLQRIGVVRFDAFEEVGGKQSFAVVLANAQDDGVVLSSVYSRRDVRIYAKFLHAGKPSHPLTDEEREALDQARANRMA
ncbi:MAG: DUF4446 family protein [Chthonomonadales bacterium]